MAHFWFEIFHIRNDCLPLIHNDPRLFASSTIPSLDYPSAQLFHFLTTHQLNYSISWLPISSTIPFLDYHHLNYSPPQLFHFLATHQLNYSLPQLFHLLTTHQLNYLLSQLFHFLAIAISTISFLNCLLRAFTTSFKSLISLNNSKNTQTQI